MKLRVSLALPNGGVHDVTLSCDVTATVAETAHALVSAGVSGDRRLEETSRRRLAPVTLRAISSPGSAPVLLDPAAPIGASGLQSGWIIQPVLEFGTAAPAHRLFEPAGYVDVLNGEQQGVQFSLVAGTNLVGRDPGCRVQIHDPSVSRRHAEIRIAADGIRIVDLGSANGVLVGDTRTPRPEHQLLAPTTVLLGTAELRISPGPPAAQRPCYDHRVMHTRAPRVAPHFPSSERELPAPPAPQPPSRLPVLAMLTPMLMGTVMYAITRSPMSLVMIAFSPMMMIGSWLDNTLGRTRKLKREIAEFDAALAAERVELAESQAEEIQVRASETPTIDDVRTAIVRRDELLWTRRPEHRAFLEVRFGLGTLPSRTTIASPPRGESPREQWETLQRVISEHEQVSPVPVIERFARCGSIGIVGDPIWSESMAASLVLQLVGLHSPYEMVLTCFAGPQHEETWSWLKWLPHVDPVASPIDAWQLADTEATSLRLITALEELLATRRNCAGSKSHIRSHLDRHTRNDESQGDAVTEMPTLPAVIVVVLEDSYVEQARLIELGERGPDHGIHLIWVADRRATLPAVCRTFVELGEASGHVHFVRTGTIVPLRHLELIDAPEVLSLARALAPVEDTAARVLDESDLPKSVHLRDLHTTDLLGSSGPILRTWRGGGTLTSAWTPGEERPAVSIDAVVGQGPDGHTRIDLRTHGPHALVGGTTGAGKSEFLQTWIMSMAANVSPDRLTYLLRKYPKPRPQIPTAASTRACHPA